jgi:hypothetical protein
VQPTWIGGASVAFGLLGFADTSSKLKCFEVNRGIAAAFSFMKLHENQCSCLLVQALVAHGPFSRKAAFTMYLRRFLFDMASWKAGVSVPST